jgi:hypothetical protein
MLHCKGICRNSVPCKNTSSLDSFGYCKCHVKQYSASDVVVWESSPSCHVDKLAEKQYSASDVVVWESSPSCHVDKLAEKVRSCTGLTLKGQPCNTKYGIVDGRCHHHTLNKDRSCTGLTLKGQPCNTKYGIVDGRCYHHKLNKTLANSFRIQDLRFHSLNVVKNYRKNVDVYTGFENKATDHIDHVFELHMVATLCDRVSVFGTDYLSKKQTFIDFLKCHAVNEVENLNVTDAKINVSKFSILEQFTRDYSFQKVNPNGLQYYFETNNVSIARPVTAMIRKEIAKSYKYILGKLEYENEIHQKFECEMQEMFCVMKVY